MVTKATEPSPGESYEPPSPAEPPYAEPPLAATATEAPVPLAPIAFPTVPLPAFDPLAGAATAGLAEPLPSGPIPSPASMPAPPVTSPSLSLPVRPSVPIAAPSGASLASRLSVAQARVVAAVPPEWLALARRQPVLWMVVIPVTLASLLILLAVAVSPDVETARPEPLTVAPASSAPQVAEPAPAAAPAPPPPAPDDARLATLEGKSPDSLSVDEVLVLKAHRAELKRKEAQSAVTKLQQADAPKDAASQRELLRLASDPDTAELTLSALARASSPAAKDVLYEVWTSRTVPAPLAELAGALLSSRDVRAGASPALAAALELRTARSCDAVQAALPHARTEGDRRSLAPLGKLASRRGCGADKSDDCYPCLRADMKQVNATIEAVKRRKAPSFGPN